MKNTKKFLALMLAAAVAASPATGGTLYAMERSGEFPAEMAAECETQKVAADMEAMTAETTTVETTVKTTAGMMTESTTETTTYDDEPGYDDIEMFEKEISITLPDAYVGKNYETGMLYPRTALGLSDDWRLYMLLGGVNDSAGDSWLKRVDQDGLSGFAYSGTPVEETEGVLTFGFIYVTGEKGAEIYARVMYVFTVNPSESATEKQTETTTASTEITTEAVSKVETETKITTSGTEKQEEMTTVSKTENQSKTTTSEVPKTGDDTNLPLWVLLMAGSATVTVWLWDIYFKERI